MISGQTYLRTIIIGPKSSSFSSWLCSRIPTPRRLFPGLPPPFINNNNNNNNNNTRLFSLYPPAAQQEGKEIPQHDEQFRPPLHILFCGSDHFSATSLKALYQEHRHDPRTSVASIDVVCRRDKRVGRGLKTIREVPIKSVAQELELPLHEIDTFTGWQPPNIFNLIIAVSFGRRVPERLLNQSFYSGINVHPSLLPSYRGAAPIYHVLLDAKPFTGVTIQTLHPLHIDHGAILMQSPEVPIAKGTSYQELHDTLAVLGARMLIHTCRNRLFEKPYKPIESPYPPSAAPKIDPDLHSRVRWKDKTAEEVERYCGVLNTVWCRLGPVDFLDRRKRVILTQISCLDEDAVDPDKQAQPGEWRYHEPGHGEGALVIKCKSGWVQVEGIKIEGKRLTRGSEWARSLIVNNQAPTVFT